MLNSYREVLTSLLATAMITSSLLPSSGPYHQAGVVDAGGVMRAMEIARGGLAAGGWSAPAAKQSDIPAANGRQVAVATLRSPETDAFQRLAARAVALDSSGPLGKKTSAILELARDGEEFPIYQIKVESGSDLHLYHLAKNGSGRVILASRIGDAAYYFALDSQLRPTAAAVKYRGQEMMAVMIDSVRSQLHQMLGFWVDWAAQNTQVANG